MLAVIPIAAAALLALSRHVSPAAASSSLHLPFVRTRPTPSTCTVMRASLRPQRSSLAWLCGLLLLLAASAALVTPASASAGSTRARAYGESTIDIQVEQSPAEKAWLAKTHHTQEEKEGEQREK